MSANVFCQKVTKEQITKRINDLKTTYCSDDEVKVVNSICYWKHIYATVPDSIYVKEAVTELVKEKKDKRKASWYISDYNLAMQDIYNAKISIHQ